MSMCVVDGKACQCQPSEGFPCRGVVALTEQLQVLREALRALRLAREQDKYRSWEKGIPEFQKAEALADAALEATK